MSDPQDENPLCKMVALSTPDALVDSQTRHVCSLYSASLYACFSEATLSKRQVLAAKVASSERGPMLGLSGKILHSSGTVGANKTRPSFGGYDLAWACCSTLVERQDAQYNQLVKVNLALSQA